MKTSMKILCSVLLAASLVVTASAAFAKKKTYDGKFSDVAADAWHNGFVGALEAAGIMSGDGNGSFRPDHAITREEMVAILCRYAKHMGYDTSARTDLTVFPDFKNVKSWAKAPLGWAAAEGLFYGAKTSTGAYKINPNGLTTRAEAASFIYRFCMLNAQ